MTQKERGEKKGRACLYYMRGETQKAIASIVGISEVYLKRVKEENLDRKRAAEGVTLPELVNQNLQLIERQ